MQKKGFERIVALIAAVIVIGVTVAIVILGEPHGTFGDSFAPGEVNSRIIMDQGHIEDPAIPDGLLILGAGQPAVLKFEVFNLDPDNDIDTIEVKIPGAEILSGTSEWYREGMVHEWSYEPIDIDTVLFEAQDDFTGSEGGDIPYYDTAGNIDDALDFIEDYNDGDNPVYDLSEGITLTVSFNAPGNLGFRMGTNSIDLRVGDLKTESPGAPLTSFEPFPYPFLVTTSMESYLIMVLETPSCHLEVEYGDDHLFSFSRSGDFRTSIYGFEYVTDDGATVAALSDPGDTHVEAIVVPKEDGLTGQYLLDIYKIKITNIETGSFEKTIITDDYQDDIPSEIGMVVDTDQDDDGILNNDDDDMDGDGIPNTEDLFPKIYNRLPVVVGKSANLTTKENEVITLTVNANDPDMETLTYTWTNDQDPEWNASGNRIDLTGLEPGDYLFSVKITDELGNSRVETIKVTVIENQTPIISDVSADNTKITVGDDVTLTVNVTDPEDETLTFTWTHDQDPEWKETGNPITVKDLEKGEYIFTVKVSDGWSNVTETIQVTVKEKDEGGFPWIPIIVGIVVIVLILVIVLVLVLRRRGKDKPTGEGTGTPGVVGYPEGGEGEMPTESSYENFYDPNDKEISTGSYTPDAPLEFYPAEPQEVAIEQSHEGANMMDYPQDHSQGALSGYEQQMPTLPENPPMNTLPQASLEKPHQMPEGTQPSFDTPTVSNIPAPPPPAPTL